MKPLMSSALNDAFVLCVLSPCTITLFTVYSSPSLTMIVFLSTAWFSNYSNINIRNKLICATVFLLTFTYSWCCCSNVSNAFDMYAVIAVPHGTPIDRAMAVCMNQNTVLLFFLRCSDCDCELSKLFIRF